MIYNELNTGFRWYDSIDKQTRFKEYCENLCTYGLLNPCNDLLPFQIKSSSFGVPTSWNLVYLDGEQLVPVVTPGVDASPVSWSVVLNSGTPFALQLVSSTFGTTYGCANWTTNLNTTMALLVTSVNTNTNAGTIFGAVYPFDNSVGFTASWDIGTQTLTVTPPLNSYAYYNGCFMQLAANGASWGGDVGLTRTFSGGVDEETNIILTDTINIDSCLPFLNQYTIQGSKYIQYNGGDLPGCLSVQMDCGKWYSTISDGTNTLYSDVFEVLPISDITFDQSKLPIFSAWRWYDSKSKQTRYKEYCDNLCDYYSLSGNDALLPFQVANEDSAETPIVQSWKLISIDEDCEYLLPINYLQIVNTISHGYRIIYDGTPIELPCGKFYSVIDDGIEVWYSELIQITDALNTNANYLMTDDSEYIQTDDSEYITID